MRISDWSSDVCSSDLQVHAVAKRRHETDPGGAEESSERAAVIAFVQIANRLPIEFRIGSVNASGNSFKLLLDLDIFRNIAARRRRDLHQHAMPAPLRIHPQQAFEGFHAFAQAFRVVPPVDAADQGAVAQDRKSTSLNSSP